MIFFIAGLGNLILLKVEMFEKIFERFIVKNKILITKLMILFFVDNLTDA